MPSTISSAHKSQIKSTLPSSSFRILTATQARIYIAHPDPSRWTYAGLEGALALVVDKSRGGCAWKLVDLKVSVNHEREVRLLALAVCLLSIVPPQYPPIR